MGAEFFPCGVGGIHAVLGDQAWGWRDMGDRTLFITLDYLF